MVVRQRRNNRVLVHPPVQDHVGCDAELVAEETINGTWVVGCPACYTSVEEIFLVDACRAWNRKNLPAPGNDPF